MHKKKEYIVSSYKFVYIPEPETVKIVLSRRLIKYDIKGTFIIGNEGINGSFSIEKENLVNVCKIIENLIATTIKFKHQTNNNHSFLRLKIKLKEEIVTLGQKNINPQKNSGKYLDPQSWEKLIKNQDAIIIDTRNKYESNVGSFKSSVETKTKNFRDFPVWIMENKQKLKNKRLVYFVLGELGARKQAII